MKKNFQRLKSCLLGSLNDDFYYYYYIGLILRAETCEGVRWVTSKFEIGSKHCKPRAKAEKLLRWIMFARCKTRNLALNIISPVICTTTVSTLVVNFSEVKKPIHHQRYHFKNLYWNLAVKFGFFLCFFLVRYTND